MDEHCGLSFQHFSTISNLSMFPKNVMGSEASEKHFGSSGGVRGGIWEHPGGSGRRLEGSWGCPGGSGGRLGRVLGALGAILERPLRQSDFGSIF